MSACTAIHTFTDFCSNLLATQLVFKEKKMSSVPELCGGMREPLVVYVHLMHQPGARMPAELEDLEAAVEDWRRFERWHTTALFCIYFLVLLAMSVLFLTLGCGVNF